MIFTFCVQNPQLVSCFNVKKWNTPNSTISTPSPSRSSPWKDRSLSRNSPSGGNRYPCVLLSAWPITKSRAPPFQAPSSISTMTHRQRAEITTTSSRPDTCNYHGFAPNVVSTSSGKLTSKIFSSVRIKSCLQKWKDCRSLSWARWQHGQGYKWDLLGMSKVHCLFVFFLTLSHCLYRLFMCTTRGPQFVCFIPYPVRTVFTDCFCVLS